MKIMKKALALLVALIMVLGTVPAYADDNSNGTTITLEGIISSDSAGTDRIKSVAAGETFYMVINFDGNPADDTGMIAYNILFGYNSKKIEILKVMGGLATPAVENATYNEGVALYSWATTYETILNEDSEPQSSGRLFRLQLKAITDLVEDDLAKFKPIESATSSSGNSTKTSLSDLEKKTFILNWVSDLKEKEPLPVITIDETSFTVDTNDQEWTGFPIKPAVTSKIADLVENEHYTVSYGNNTSIGEDAGTITISLKNPDEDGLVWVGEQSYTGSANYTFDIVAKAIKEEDFNWNNVQDTPFTGDPIEPVVESKTGLIKDTHYTVNYDGDTTNAGTVKVIVEGMGNYGGRIEKSFEIEKINIEGLKAQFSIDTTEQEYKDSSVEPTVTHPTLVKGEHYTVRYSNNTAPGLKGKITVEGINNYEGTIIEYFQIKAKQQVADGNIGLGIAFTSIEDDAVVYDPDAKISSVNKGDKFVMWVNVSENPVFSLDDTIVAYDLLLQYDKDAIKLGTYADAMTNPIVNLNFNENTIAASWTNEKGIIAGSPAKLQKNATLFVIVAEALKDLKAEDLKEVIRYTEEEIKYDEDKTQKTNFAKWDGTPYNISKVETLHNIKDNFVTVSKEDEVYTGSEIIPEITLNNLEGDLDETKYEITYDDNVNVGPAKVTVKGLGNYYDEFTTTFNIVEKGITADDFEIADQPYTGSAIEPAIETALIEGTDYEVVGYGDNKDVGENAGSVTIKGINNYKDTITLNFNIVAKVLEDADFTLAETEKEYTGDFIEVGVTSDLVLDVDYTVDYSDNKELGTATVTITGVEPNYTGTVVKTFEITARKLKVADFTLAETEKEYTGDYIEVDVNTELPDEAYDVEYYNNKELGTATVIITGIEPNYTGTVKLYFDIVAKSIESLEGEFTFSIDDDGYEYTGEPIKPAVTHPTLIEGIDYEVRYENNENASTEDSKAKVIVIGKGKYGSKIEKPFTINAKAITAADFEIADQVYAGSKIEPAIETALIEGTDYEVVGYGDNKDVGENAGTVTVKGKGNYKNEITLNFNIVRKDIAEVEGEFTFVLDAITFDGTEHKPEVSTTNVLTAGTDYKVEYSDNKNAGTATITVTGEGNYTGEIVKTFTINPAPIDATQFEYGDDQFGFAISERHDVDSKLNAEILATDGVRPEVKSKSESIKENIDYEVIYTNNKATGTATITIKGIGNYTNEVTKDFEILTYRLGDVDNDGTWGTLDAIKILKMATDLYPDTTELEELAAQVVKGDSINAVDALEVLKYSALIEGALYNYYNKF